MDARTELKAHWDGENYKALLTTMQGLGFSQRLARRATGVNTFACPIEPVAPAAKCWATLTVPNAPFERGEYDVEITFNTHAPRPYCVNWVNNDQQHVFKRVVPRSVADEIVEFAESLG